MVNKKGQEMSISTLVIIIIAIVVLVLVVLGFTMGWGNLWSKLTSFTGSSNLGDIANGCKIAATSGSTFTFCSEFKAIKGSEPTEYVNCQAGKINDLLGDSKAEAKDLKCANDVAEKFAITLALKKYEGDNFIINSGGATPYTFKVEEIATADVNKKCHTADDCKEVGKPKCDATHKVAASGTTITETLGVCVA